MREASITAFGNILQILGLEPGGHPRPLRIPFVGPEVHKAPIHPTNVHFRYLTQSFSGHFIWCFIKVQYRHPLLNAHCDCR